MTEWDVACQALVMSAIGRSLVPPGSVFFPHCKGAIRVTAANLGRPA